MAVAILLANDHALRARYPSWLTGKLSDLAGLHFAPCLLLAAGLAIVWLAGRWVGGAGEGRSARVGSARFVARHQERAARRGLGLALLLAPAYCLVCWLIEVGVSVAARAWPGCLE